MSLLAQQYDRDSLFLGMVYVVDCYNLPLEKVAAAAPWKRLSIPSMILRHPDLWHDGVWEDGKPGRTYW